VTVKRLRKLFDEMDPSVDPDRHLEVSGLLGVHDKFRKPINDYMDDIEISEVQGLRDDVMPSELQRYVSELCVMVMPRKYCADLSSLIDTAEVEARQWLPLAAEQLTRENGSSRQRK
jgi:hypothetical protein